MDCSVPGCERRAISNVGRNDEFHFCGDHSRAWGYYYQGFRKASGFVCDGRIHRKNWDEAMREFLEHCRMEIVGMEQLAMGILGER